MRSAYAHEARLDLLSGGDSGAVGAAVTVALCGHWEHEPPCPLAPHHTEARREGDDLLIRILFAVPADREHEVRERIVAALSAGTGPSLDGGAVFWRLMQHGSAVITASEADHAGRLASGG